jgi:predicted ABC-type ATPase
VVIDRPRLRMFAGPNGSGKSTLKSVVKAELLGYYINSDEIELELRSKSGFMFDRFDLAPTADDLRNHLLDHGLNRYPEFTEASAQLVIEGGRAFLTYGTGTAYVAAAISDFIRLKLRANAATFSFETVMSSPDKVAFMRSANENGYRTYLYYIATSDPAINVSRVANRVQLGGHGVPTEKILSRYHRSLDLLADAIQASSRAYIFDNSADGEDRVWIAEFTDGKVMEIKADKVPDWFDCAVLKKLA